MSSEMCGGNGCKTQRQFQSQTQVDQTHDFEIEQKIDKIIEKQMGAEWVCSDCSFANSDQNDHCGGRGRMGCHQPRRKVDTNSSPLFNWDCKSCGFMNRGGNIICGGGGGKLGCKARKY